MTARIIPFPGVALNNEPVETHSPQPVSFDDARPGWEQQISEAAVAIEYAETEDEWVKRCTHLATLLGDLSASIIAGP